MKAAISIERSDGSTVLTQINPIIKRGLHRVTVTRTDKEKKNRIANFVVDNEKEALDFIVVAFAGDSRQLLQYRYIQPNVIEAWHKNKLEEFYA